MTMISINNHQILFNVSSRGMEKSCEILLFKGKRLKGAGGNAQSPGAFDIFGTFLVEKVPVKE